MGNVTKILVRPYLYVCGELCPLENLKNVKIKINSIKTENNQEIPSVNVIDNIELSYNKELSFEYQVPPKLQSVNFELSGEIKYKTRNYFVFILIKITIIIIIIFYIYFMKVIN